MTQMPNIPDCSFEYKNGEDFLIDSEGDIIDAFDIALTNEEQELYMRGLKIGCNLGYNYGLWDKVNEIKKVLDIK